MNNNQEFDTALAKITAVGTLYAPMGGQPVSATNYGPATSPYVVNGHTISPSGSQAAVSGTTSTLLNTTYSSSYTDWPTNYIANNLYMPAMWTVNFTPTKTCYNPSTPPTATPPYPTEPATQSSLVELLPGVGILDWAGLAIGSASPPSPIKFTCYINTAANPLISQSAVLPRFVLDDAVPSSIQVASLDQLTTPAASTYLHFFNSTLVELTKQVATSVASDGSSATFPYPTGSNGSALPAGGYLATITTNITPLGAPFQEQTHSIEPVVIAHNAHTYPGAFGVAYAAPQTIYMNWGADDIYGDGSCQGTPYSYTWTGGFAGPVVSSVTQNKVLLPNNTSVNVGTAPTVVLPLNYSTDYETDQDSRCDFYSTQYNGPQSILTVNTGSSSVSIVQIGDEPYASGTVAVGNQPVAAALGPNGLVYIANYADGTISEVNTSSLLQTRVLSVMAHPTSVSFDTSGNLWVGGQGALEEISLSQWVAIATTPVDGTIAQMTYSPPLNAMIQTVLQNGTVSSPSNGGTLSAQVSYSSGNSSYSTSMVSNVSTGAVINPSLAIVTNASYVQSSIASYLAFPAQTAFVPATLSNSHLTLPPISASSSDVVMVANGNTFTLSALPSGSALMSGTVPYPIRAIAIGNNTIYVTMTESNSVVSFPISF